MALGAPTERKGAPLVSLLVPVFHLRSAIVAMANGAEPETPRLFDASNWGGTLNQRRSALFIDKASSISLACLAMSFARIQGRKEVSAQETFSYHALSAAYRLRNPLEILTRRETELPMHLVEQLQSISVRAVQTVAR